jgi:bacteriocin-like protein
MFHPLNDDELSLVSGGMTNAEHPGVQAALRAFYGVLFCGGSTQAPPTTIAYPDGSVGKTPGGSFPNCSPA